MNEIKYITSEQGEFYKNTGGFLGLKIGEKGYPRVSLVRSFPYTHLHNFISIRDKENNEIGIIEDILTFPENIIELFNEELNRRYFLPIIKNIYSVKEEYGYSYWNVLTDLGNKKFTIRRDNYSFINVKDNRVMVIDVDGNRYEISDYEELDSKSYRLIELML